MFQRVSEVGVFLFLTPRVQVGLFFRAVRPAQSPVSLAGLAQGTTRPKSEPNSASCVAMSSLTWRRWSVNPTSSSTKGEEIPKDMLWEVV